MTEADPCRSALTPAEDAALYAEDALRAAGQVMAGRPPSEADAAYLAVYALLAAVALGQGGALSAYPSGGVASAAKDVG